MTPPRRHAHADPGSDPAEEWRHGPSWFVCGKHPYPPQPAGCGSACMDRDYPETGTTRAEITD